MEKQLLFSELFNPFINFYAKHRHKTDNNDYSNGKWRMIIDAEKFKCDLLLNLKKI